MSLSRITRTVNKGILTRPMPVIFLVLMCLLAFPVRSTHSLATGQDSQESIFMTFTVSNTGDNGGVDPAPLAGTGTLRQAIVDANANAGPDAINFGIGGAAPFIISVAVPLPAITGTVTIDGTTQPGFGGTPIIELNGLSAGSGNGLTINASGCIVRGLVINRFPGSGIAVSGNSNVIEGNLIGTNIAGTFGNDTEGVLITGSSNTVGGTAIAARNIISGNRKNGIRITAGTANSIVSNSIFQNGDLGIDLGPGFVTQNDAGDVDVGANNLQNFPVITSASPVGISTAIAGTLNSTANAVFRIEFYSNQTSNPSGFGEGQSFIGFALVTTDLSGNAAFNQTLPVTVAPGQIITATATNTGGDTSEFSRSIQVGLVGGTPADLTIATTITGAPESGSDVTKRILVTNAGPATANSVTVTDVLSGNLSFISCSAAGGGVCGGSGNIRTVTFASLAPGATVDITITARLSCATAAGAAVSNTATVFSSSTPDNNPANNIATATTTAVNPPPRITCPPNITTTNDPGACFATVSFAVPVTDNCPGVNVVCTPSGSTFPIGATTVSCIATDSGGATATCSFTVTVTDIERISISCPPNISVTASAGNCRPFVTYPPPTINDNCPGASASCSPPSGSSFQIGVTNVVCTAVDARGVQATCGFTVTVIATPQALVTLEGNGSSLDFGRLPASRKLRKLKKQSLRSFTIENVGCSNLVLTFNSLNRIGADVDRGLIEDPDDRILFFLTKVDFKVDPSDPLGRLIPVETPFEILTDVTIPCPDCPCRDCPPVPPDTPRNKQLFRLRFNPLIPAVDTNGKLSADEVLPDFVNSVLTLTQNGGPPLRINLIAHVDTDVMLIDPDNPRRLPVAQFLRSGNEFIVEFSIYDSNLDVNQVVYQFFGNKQRPVFNPITVDLTSLVEQSDFVVGQSFTISQRVTGARDHPEVIGVEVTVSDSESSFSVQSIPGGSAAQQLLLKSDPSKTLLFPPALNLITGKRRTN